MAANLSEPKKRVFYGWYVLAAITFVLCMSFGTSTSIGVYFKPIVEEFGWLRGDLSLGISIGYFLFALSSPIIGRIIDRIGVRPVFIVGIVMMAVGFALMSMVSRLWHVYIYFGVLVSLGGASTTFVTVSATVIHWFEKRRGMALSIGNAGGALGLFLVVYLAAFLISRIGWRLAFVYSAVILAATTLPVILFVIRNDPKEMGLQPDGRTADGRAAGAPGAPSRNLAHLDWRQAMKTRPFFLISTGYFACGFSVTLFTIHTIPYATDLGFDFQTAAWAVSFSGFFNVIGTLLAGVISDRTGRKNILGITYFVRGMSFVIFLLWQNLFTLYLFAAVIGFSYFATVPLTAGLTGDIYGSKNMGIIYGTMTGVHQIGSAVGVYLGGLMFDWTGSYRGAYMMAVVLLMGASLVSFMVRESRYREPVPAES